MVETTVGGFASYVELLICLEMARDVSDEKTNPHGPLSKTECSRYDRDGPK
jgi:hypothetical protein